MSLVFKVAKLQEAAQAAVKRYEDARALYEQNFATYRVEHRKQWMNAHMEGVAALRDYLTRQIRMDRPPIHSDARRYLNPRGGDLYLYTPPTENNTNIEKPAGFYNQHIETTRAMVAFLDAYEGDTITAAQLKVVGFDDLASLYRQAVGS